MTEALGAGLAAASQAVLGGVARGDIALRALSFDRLDADRPPPFLLAATHARAKIRLEVTVGVDRTLLFGLFGERTEEKIADVRYDLGVAPARGVAQAARPSRVRWATPPFLVRERGGYVVVGPGGTRLVLDSSSDPIALRDPSGQRLGASGRWPVDTVLDLLEALRTWMADRKAARSCDYELRPHTLLGDLLGIAVGAQRDVLDQVARIPPLEPRAQQALQAHPDLNPYYRIDYGRIRILTRAGGHGELVRNSDSDRWIRIDLESLLLESGPGTVIQLSYRLPDFLFEGRDFAERFFDAVLTGDGLARLRRATQRAFRRISDPSFATFARSVDRRRSILLRIDPDDNDLVLLWGEVRGSEVWFLYQVKFEVESFPHVHPTATRLRLLAGSYLGDRRGDPLRLNKLTRFFKTLFGALVTWQEGIAREAEP